MTHWSETLPPELTVEQGGQQVAIREMPFVKEAPDLPTFVKNAVATKQEFGARIPIKASTPEEREAWRKEHLPKLHQAGILEPPPAKVEDYGIARPEAIPERAWDPAVATELGAILHKHGAAKALAPELLALHAKVVQAGLDQYKTDGETVLAQLKTQFGDQLDARLADAERFAKTVFTDPADLEFLNRTGLGNHPRLLALLMKLAPMAAQDSSFIRDARSTAGNLTGPAALEEARKIQLDKTHPKYELYHKGDKATVDYVTALHLAANPAERSL